MSCPDCEKCDQHRPDRSGCTILSICLAEPGTRLACVFYDDEDIMRVQAAPVVAWGVCSDGEVRPLEWNCHAGTLSFMDAVVPGNNPDPTHLLRPGETLAEDIAQRLLFDQARLCAEAERKGREKREQQGDH